MTSACEGDIASGFHLGRFGDGGAAATSMTQAKAPLLNTPAPAFYRFKLGTIEATVVSDGPLSIGDPKTPFAAPQPGCAL